MNKILLIEDDTLWKLKLQVMLDELGYEIMQITSNVTDSLIFLQKQIPDLIVADICLKDESIFEMFEKNVSLASIPTIFITQSTKEIHYSLASKLNKQFYLVKPIHKLTLKSTISNLLEGDKNNVEFIEIKGSKNEKINLPLNHIIYIEQIGNYCNINTITKQFVIKKSLTNFIDKLNDTFIQVHRSFVVNRNHIESYGNKLEYLKLKGNKKIPIGRLNRENVKGYLAKTFIEKNEKLIVL